MSKDWSKEELQNELRNETLKWLRRIEREMENLRVDEINKDGEEFLKNIKAYINDTYYFLEKNDLIRAFECVIWAWAWLEIGLRTGLLSKCNHS